MVSQVEVKVEIKAANVTGVIEQKRRQLEIMRTSELRKIGEEEVRITQERIRSSKTGPDGKAWAPWSIATLKQRQRRGDANKGLLYRTGALLQSIKFKVEDGKLTVYSDAQYGKYLQFGTPKMPARPFIGWGDRINSIVERLTKVFK